MSEIITDLRMPKQEANLKWMAAKPKGMDWKKRNHVEMAPDKSPLK